jgi:hypothetical protein
MREVSRFGQATKVWLGIAVLVMGLVAVWTIPSWRDFVETELLFGGLFGVLLGFHISQRVWYDDRSVCTRMLGKRRECMAFADIESVSASHSWRRAATNRPMSELQITNRNGRSMLISLRHLSVSGLQEMVDEIHRQTGLPVPELRKFVN